MDSSDTKLLKVVKRGRIDSKSVEQHLGSKIRRKPINRDVLVTDSESAYNALATAKNMIHYKIPSGKYINEKGHHIQKVNALHRKLDQWMNQFNGVASKYLQNYLNYFITLEKSKGIRDRFIKIWEWIIDNKKAFIPYRHIYQQF